MKIPLFCPILPSIKYRLKLWVFLSHHHLLHQLHPSPPFLQDVNSSPTPPPPMICSSFFLFRKRKVWPSPFYHSSASTKKLYSFILFFCMYASMEMQALSQLLYIRNDWKSKGMEDLGYSVSKRKLNKI